MMNLQAVQEKDAGTGGAERLPAHEVAYRALRERVLFGQFEPGQAVTIQGLVAELGAGMTPVREALRRMMAEGALEFRGNRRISVPVLSSDHIGELRFARLALEPELARRACRNTTNADILALEEADAQLDEAIRRGNVHDYLVQNHHFHARLNHIADAPVLSGLVDGLWLRFGPSLRVVCGQFGTRNLPDMHKDLIVALKAGDCAAAAEAITGDVTQGMDMIAQSI
ncbi:GntR family transcriptional regulator [Pseudooceanicola algae]|uniref:HTH-type transcriptional regulator McbR n=1 Tax=Pseudooceanicola algae TaxID=1537215 RepID=A0A418SB94_9RHOB|nr:GntR family transcriptional regulator [Pseudooceanicola algae]QPM91388.1 HTH-type transcriptional regulator McbR [Pseudooceanicola algae]